MARDSLWFLYCAAIALLALVVTLLTFPVALIHGLWVDLRDWRRSR